MTPEVIKIPILSKVHSDEVKMLVNKAVKDLSIEQTLKKYEEIWLSKVFEFELYVQQNQQNGTKYDEEVRF